MPRKFLARGIEVWWPEKEDRQKGAPAGRAHELRSALDGVRRKRGMTGGSHDHQINIWALPGGLSADPARTVREAGVTILPPKRNLVPRFSEWLKGELEIGVYLDRLVAIPDI